MTLNHVTRRFRLAHKSSFWARSATVSAKRDRTSAERERASSCRVLPHQTRKPSERLWESLPHQTRKPSERLWESLLGDVKFVGGLMPSLVSIGVNIFITDDRNVSEILLRPVCTWTWKHMMFCVNLLCSLSQVFCTWNCITTSLNKLVLK